MRICRAMEVGMRRVVAVVMSVLLSIGLVGAAGVGVANAAKSTPCSGKTLIDDKNKGTASNPTAVKAPGQVNIVTGALSNSQGTVFGTYTSVHTVVAVNPDGSYEILNTTTYKLPRGTILTSGNEMWTTVSEQQQPTVQVVPAVGGTGLYAGVSGTATSVPDPWPINVVFKFTNN
jgi:hypothetical protein